MRRLQTRRAVILVVIVCLTVFVAGCSGDAVEDAALSAIVGNEDHYDGRTLRIEGTVRWFNDPQGGHAVIEDREQNRVELRPADQAAPFIDQRVIVVGRFTFADDSGRRLDLDEITPAD